MPQSLDEIKALWEDCSVWPETKPINLYGPAAVEPDDPVYMDRGGDPILDREAL